MQYNLFSGETVGNFVVSQAYRSIELKDGRSASELFIVVTTQKGRNFASKDGAMEYFYDAEGNTDEICDIAQDHVNWMQKRTVETLKAGYKLQREEWDEIF